MKAGRIMLAVAAVAGLFALTTFWQHGSTNPSPQGAVQAQTARPDDTFRLVWSQPVVDLRSTSLSADGTAIVTVDNAGRVQLWDWQRRPSHALWDHAILGASQVGVGPGGHTVLAYAPLDPTRKTLFFLGDGGRLIARSTLDGAIWDVTLSADGTYAGVTTGNHSVYLYTLGSQLSQRRWKLSGIGNSVALTSEATCLTAGTWDASGVTCYTPQGATLWRYPDASQPQQAFSNRLFEAQVAGSGQAVLGISYANVREGNGTLYYWHKGSNGTPAWTHRLDQDAFYPDARISEDGRCVAVTYTQQVTHGDQSINERRLLVLDAEGHTLLERGGLLFPPTLVAIAADGHRVTVSDGRNTLYHLNTDRRLTVSYRFHGTIRQAVATPDGRWLLVYTGDGRLNLLKLG